MEDMFKEDEKHMQCLFNSYHGLLTKKINRRTLPFMQAMEDVRF